MNDVKLAKKIAHISNKYFDKHETNKDSFSNLMAEMLYDFKAIAILSSELRVPISGQSLLTVLKASKNMDKNINEIKTNPSFERYSKKYSAFIDKVLKRKDALLEIIKINNRVEKTFEIYIADDLLSSLRLSSINVERKYDYLKEIVIKGSKNGYINNHIESDVFTILSQLKKADKINTVISQLTTTPEFKQDLKTIQVKAEKLNDEIASKVIKYYDELEELDIELHNSSKLLSSQLKKELNAYKTEQKEVKEDIENDL